MSFVEYMPRVCHVHGHDDLRLDTDLRGFPDVPRLRHVSRRVDLRRQRHVRRGADLRTVPHLQR